MLLNNFFFVDDIRQIDLDTQVALTINASHSIFDGHFPGQPVVPGVCMMQMVKEIVENSLSKETKLLKAHEMKFLAVIDPSRNNLINATIKYSIAEDNDITVTATFFKDDLTHFKFKGIFSAT